MEWIKRKKGWIGWVGLKGRSGELDGIHKNMRGKEKWREEDGGKK